MEEKINQEMNTEPNETPNAEDKSSKSYDEQQHDGGASASKDQKRSSKKGKKGGDHSDELNEKIAQLEETIAQKNDQYLRLQAEFDNYRKRTLKEKMELTKSATSSLMVNIITVVDDFERALQMMGGSNDLNAVKEGVELIYKRFSDFLKQNGVAEIDAVGKELDTDLHEAITKIPAPSEEFKGKIVDVVQKGYSLNDKVIRFAKVVIGE